MRAKEYMDSAKDDIVSLSRPKSSLLGLIGTERVVWATSSA